MYCKFKYCLSVAPPYSNSHLKSRTIYVILYLDFYSSKNFKFSIKICLPKYYLKRIGDCIFCTYDFVLRSKYNNYFPQKNKERPLSSEETWMLITFSILPFLAYNKILPSILQSLIITPKSKLLVS